MFATDDTPARSSWWPHAPPVEAARERLNGSCAGALQRACRPSERGRSPKTLSAVSLQRRDTSALGELRT